MSVAHDICARVRYGGDDVVHASDEVILQRLPALGGSGGVIVLDGQGRLHMPFNTSGMYRAAIDGEGRRSVAIYRNKHRDP